MCNLGFVSTRIKCLFIVVTFAFLLLGCSTGSDSDTPGGVEEGNGESGSADSSMDSYTLQQVVEDTITISSSATSKSTGQINKKHTCEGNDTSPPLAWEGVPDEAVSLVLIMDDPASDELGGLGLWNHWVMYSIPTNVTELSVGQAYSEVLENGAKQGINDYEGIGYSGPCPRHNIYYSESTDGRTPPLLALVRPYNVRLYALDKELDLGPGATRDALLEEIDGSIIAAGVLPLPYKSKKKTIRAGKEVNADN